MSSSLLLYTEQLARRVQESWNDSVRTEMRKQLNNPTNTPDATEVVQRYLNSMSEGKFDFRRNYRVTEKEDRYLIVYNCNVSAGQPKIHCVVSKTTGDVARHCIKLVEEAFFQFNLLDERSRADCLSQANYKGDYLL